MSTSSAVRMKATYTGVTNNMERRLQEHRAAIDPESYTASRLPVQLVFCEHMADSQSAINLEKKIKGWSRKKKEALIRWEAYLLLDLSECQNITHHRNKERGLKATEH